MSKCNVIGITFTNNEETIVPYVMEYWKKIGVDKLVVYDNESEDNTVSLLKQYPFVEIKSWSTNGVFDEIALTQKRNNVWKTEEADWVILTDFDEVPYCETDLKRFLNSIDATIIKTHQYDVIREDLPAFDNFLLHQLEGNLFRKEGTAYDKNHTFNLKMIKEMNYSLGCHSIMPVGEVNVLEYPRKFYFFHLRYLGKDFVIDRCKSRNDRLDKEQKKVRINYHYEKQMEDYEAAIARLKNGAVENYKEAKGESIQF